MFTFYFFCFICIPSFRNKSLRELRLEKEHAFQMEQMRLENERREEREHELKIFQLLLGNKVAQPIAVPPVAYAQQYNTVQQTIGNTSFCSKGNYCDDEERTYFKL